MDSVELVKKICKERGITIKQLETDCGFSNGYVRSLRKGEFPASRLYKVAEYLRVSPEYLMGVSKNTPEADELLNLFNQLNKDGRKLVLQYAQVLLKSGDYSSVFQQAEERRA